MSHTVVRGKPTLSQLYLDTILDEIIQSSTTSKQHKDVTLSELIYHRMKQQNESVFMIDGATGERITYNQILKKIIPLAKVLQQKYTKGTNVMFVMANHQNMAAVYYASLFSGVVPLTLDENSTFYELQHFLRVVPPAAVFCDAERYDDITKAVKETNGGPKAEIIIADDKHYEEFCKGYTDDIETFELSDVTPESLAIFIPTSGSSGLPKATMLMQSGLTSQLTIIWEHHENFPQPTKLALLLSTVQWMTHTIVMTSCPLYGVAILMTSQKPTSDHILEIIDKYRPDWALLGPFFAKSLAASAKNSQLASLETILTTGAPITPNITASLKEKLPKSTLLMNGIGMTEMHGFIAISGPDSPPDSVGKIYNTLQYKLIAEDGKELGANEKGELYLRCNVFKGYCNNSEAYNETVSPDGWYMTGDIVSKDENDNIFYSERKKFWFKYQNYHIAPEELENVISSVQGVQECIVTDSENGPVAGVVLHQGYSDNVASIKEQIHNVVSSTLSDYKKLRGGIVIIPALPCTASGKIKRSECKKLINSLIN